MISRHSGKDLESDDKIQGSDEGPHEVFLPAKEPQLDHDDEEEEGVRFSDLHPVEQKVVKSGALEFDIKLGWMPRSQITGPIPIAFAHPDMDDLLSEHIDPSSMIYLGFRPTNTFEVHQAFYNNGQNYPFNQFHLCKSKFLQRFFRKYYSDFQFDSTREIGMKKPDCPLEFDSLFEGGNLDFVYLKDGEYRLGVRPDTNTRGHCNYFYFNNFVDKIVRVKCKVQGKYAFRIVNMSKKRSLYERGMRPFIKTKKSGKWVQGGDNIRYGKSPLFEEFQLVKPMYSLKFAYTFQSDDDEVSFCYGIPYTYSDLIKDIEDFRKHPSCYVNKLCYTLSGVEIPLLTITNPTAEEDENQNNKKVVIISGRVHPSETHGSYIVNGFIRELLSESPEAQLLRNNIIFKIIPMINPDGVIIGNTRTSFSGKDLNRVYSAKTDFVFPEVIGVRDFTKKLKQKYGKKLLFFIDVHGHSTRKNSFFFGPEYAVFDEEYTKCRMLPRIFANKTDIFRYYSCKFRLSSQKQKTCRGYFNSKDIVRTYTHETSIHCFFDFQTRRDKAFDKGSLEDLGLLMMQAVHDYIKVTVKLIEMDIPEPVNKKKKIKGREEQDEIEIEDSDEMESDKADSEDSEDDFGRNHLQMFYNRVNANREYFYEEIMAMNGLNKQVKKEKRKVIKQVTEQSEPNKEQQNERNASIINLTSNLNNRQGKKSTKIDWASKYEFIPKKKEFLEYGKLSSVVFGGGQLIMPSFQTTIGAKTGNVQMKKSKYSFLNISPSVQGKRQTQTHFYSQSSMQSLSKNTSLSNNHNLKNVSSVKFYNSKREITQYRSEEKRILSDLIEAPKKKQFYDLASLEKLISPQRPPKILEDYESKNCLVKDEVGKVPVKEKMKSTSLRILPRKKSIKNFRNNEQFIKKKTIKNLRDTGLTSKLPSIDKLARKF